MKKNVLFLTGFLMATLLVAQNGNTINDAIEVDGTAVAVNVLDFNSATPSGLNPACGATDDVFYMHEVSGGDNKVTIGMVSAGVSLITSVDYQILLAPSGDIGNLQEIGCDSYGVLLVVGGSFEVVINNINPGDVYYLRVYKTSGLGGVLTNLLNGTSITMVSEYDSTLALESANQQDFKVLVKDNKIDLLNNTDFFEFSIYGLDGKQLAKGDSSDVLQSIDTSYLNKGVYVLNLYNNKNSESVKFVRY